MPKDKTALRDRLKAAHPGWRAWDDLIQLVASLEFQYVVDEYMGRFFASEPRLCFAETEIAFPDWLPSYVPALYGMKAAHWEMAGGYAQSFHGRPASKGAVFSPAGNDAQLGYPSLAVPAVPEELYSFQSSFSGAIFFVNKALVVLYPHAEDECFESLDALDEFTRKNIEQAVGGREWLAAYGELRGTLLD